MSAVVFASAPRAAQAEITGSSLAGFLSVPNASTVFATHAPGRPDELFVVEQRGLIHVLDLTTGTFNSTPFLDINVPVHSAGNEQGLLGLAFDPDYETNGYFYVNYTHDPGPDPILDVTRVDRFKATNPTTATFVDPATRSPVLEFDQDFGNHNGGWIGFSPNDGYLYISSGDGGSGNDPNNRAARLNTRLGKMLRVDVSGDDFPDDPTENFAVPQDNPFVNTAGALPDIWSYGLRNPWRVSFDRETGDLWIGDVGQGAREEISFQPGDSAGGENFGWKRFEGDLDRQSSQPIPDDYVPPVYDYVSNGQGLFGGNSVVGGYVYRGPDPEVRGRYFFGDSFPTQLWTFDPADPDGTVQNIESIINPSGAINTPVSFAEDAVGNLYVVTRGGGIYRIETDALLAGDYNADGVVDAGDYDAWATAYGSDQSGPDANGDGAVDAADYTLWRDAVAAQDGSAAAPEPSALSISLLAWAIASSRRRPLATE